MDKGTKNKSYEKYILPVAIGGFSIMVAAVAFADTYESLVGCSSIRACIMQWISGIKNIVAGVTIVVLIIAGILYLFSGANEDWARRAKSAITAALIGFGIVLGADIIITEVGKALGWKDTPKDVGGGARGIITRSIMFIFGIVGLLGIGAIILGGMQYLTAAGDESRARSGKKIIMYAIIGVVVAVSAMIIVGQVERIVT